MTKRVYNFSAGPAVLPEPVLEEVQRDLLALPGVGASVMEISHRGGPFKKILADAKAQLRALLAIPDDYTVLFLQGGSRLQFAMLPMNLCADAQSADYILTGSWSKHAAAEARKLCEVHTAWDGSDTNFDRLPDNAELQVDPQAAYVHFTSNETIQGVQFATEPAAGDVPLVCDASSDFLHRPLSVERYGLIYACAQKNAGPAGVTVVIVRNDLLERSRDNSPGYMSYRAHAEADSLLNTAPTFAIYVMGLVFKWLNTEIGGLSKMFERNQQKARLLYEVLDKAPDFYSGHAQAECRSLMNVVFHLPSDELTDRFVAEAEEHDLHALKGHRSVGGIRASIYNAMPIAGVEALRDFMIDFRNRHA